MSQAYSANKDPVEDRLARQEKRAECILLLGVECEKADDHEAAARLYRLGIEFGLTEIGTRYFLHNNLGYCLNRLRLYDEAERMCLAAIGIDPRRYNAYKNLGLALQGQGIYSEAAALFLKAASLYPPDHDPSSTWRKSLQTIGKRWGGKSRTSMSNSRLRHKSGVK
jgi:tetratricopeptide (TPR) repeat protein